MAKHLGDLEIIHHAMSEGKHEEALRKLSEHIGNVKKMMEDNASGDPADARIDEHEAEKHLSALAAAQDSLENTFNEVNQLLAESVA
jgi:cell fate (sporulation/competence/biofilm development) regulator YlbF (YheA/YmcA/DUF963 family)